MSNVHNQFSKKSESLRVEALNQLVHNYQCTISDGPRYLVWGTLAGEPGDKERILHWIKPCPEDRFVASRIASIINEHKGNAESLRVKTLNLEKILDEVRRLS